MKKASKTTMKSTSFTPMPCQFEVVIFNTESMGKGLKTGANTFIKKGSIIMEYGHKRYGKDFQYDCKECDNLRRSKWCCCKKHDRLMRLPDRTYLDADLECIAGYINHSNKPNCRKVYVYKNNQIHVFFEAIHDIGPNTELLWNYWSCIHRSIYL
jgi:hypothetical protein